MARIVFEVETSAVEVSLWVRVLGRPPTPVALLDGRAEANLPEGRHDLFWSISGAPHSRFRLSVHQAGLPVVVVEDQIAARVLDASGAERFTVKGREALKRIRERQDSNVTPLRPEWAEADGARRVTRSMGGRDHPALRTSAAT